MNGGGVERRRNRIDPCPTLDVIDGNTGRPGRGAASQTQRICTRGGDPLDNPAIRVVSVTGLIGGVLMLGVADKATMALIGDVAFTFSFQELLTAADLHLAIPVIVVNNGGYGAIRAHMDARRIKPIGVDLLTPDIPALAEACRCVGRRVSRVDELRSEVAAALCRSVPTVIEVVWSPRTAES